MTDLEGITLPPEALGRISAVLAAPDQKIAALVVVAGLDPGVDFRHRDLRGWPLAGEDVRGFDFTGSDLRSTGIEDALQDDTTVLVEAVLDRRAKGRANGVAQARTAPPESGYTKVRIPDVSDAELLERSFVVDDPGALENLTPTAPPTNQWLTYEGRYDVGGRVTCAFGHRHKRGYVFRDEGDRRYLVGHECGAKHLGLGRWQSFTAGRERLEERASYLRLIRDLAQAFGERREWIAGLQRDPSVLATDRLRGELRLRCPGAVSAARTAFGRSEGRLFVKATVRNHAAEERRREREQEAKEWYAGLDAERRKEFHDRGGRAPSVDRSPLHKTETRPLGTLQGRSLFGSAHGLASGIGHLLGLVDRFLAMPYTPRNRRDLMEVARNAKELVARLLRLREAVADAVDFFDQENLERFAAWADRNSFDGLRFVARPGQVAMERIEGGPVVALMREPRLARLDPEPFSAIQGAVNRVSERVERAKRRRSEAVAHTDARPNVEHPGGVHGD